MAATAAASKAAKALRILMVPVTRSSWSLSLARTPAETLAVGSEAAAAAGQLGELTSAAGSRLSSAASRQSAAIGEVTSRRTESMSQKLGSRLRKAIADAGNTWERLGDAEPTSWKGRIYAAGNRLQDRIDDREYFLRSLTTADEKSPGQQVRLVAPSNLDAREAVKYLRRLANEGIDRHRRWFQINCGLIPGTLLFAIVPGPNIPLFWNGYRVLSHWNAWSGALSLKRRLGDCEQRNVRVERDDTLDEIASVSEKHGRLDDEAIVRAATHFLSDDLAQSLRRVRYQVEQLKSENFRIER